MSVFSVTASLILGGLVDKYSARAVLPYMLLPLALGCALLSVIHAAAGAFVFMALLGISNGFMGTLIGALWPEVYGTRYLGSVRSVVFAAMVLASAVGPGLVGWLIDLNVPFDLQIAGMSVYCLGMTLVLGVATRRLNARLAGTRAG